MMVEGHEEQLWIRLVVGSLAPEGLRGEARGTLGLLG